MWKGKGKRISMDLHTKLHRTNYLDSPANLNYAGPKKMLKVTYIKNIQTTDEAICQTVTFSNSF